jgi:hypothetical protein
VPTEKQPRSISSRLRAIARSHLYYLKWSLMADRPARRQQEYRTLRIALTCPVKRPSDVPSDGLYHPCRRWRFVKSIGTEHSRTIIYTKPMPIRKSISRRGLGAGHSAVQNPLHSCGSINSNSQPPRDRW